MRSFLFMLTFILSCQKGIEQSLLHNKVVIEKKEPVRDVENFEALPPCDLSHQQNIYFIDSEMVLVLCTSENQWVRITNRGESGKTGKMGQTGRDGAPGAMGDTGSRGNTGSTGLQGVSGSTGDPGKAGVDLGDQSVAWRRIWKNNIGKVVLLDIYYKLLRNNSYVVARATAFLVGPQILAAAGYDLSQTKMLGFETYQLAGIHAKFPTSEQGDTVTSQKIDVGQIDRTYGYKHDFVLLNLTAPNPTAPVTLATGSEGITVGTPLMSIGFIGGSDFAHLVYGNIAAIQDVVDDPDWWSNFIGKERIQPGNIVYELDIRSGEMGAIGEPVFNLAGEVVGMIMMSDSADNDTKFSYALQVKHISKALTEDRRWDVLPIVP